MTTKNTDTPLMADCSSATCSALAALKKQAQYSKSIAEISGCKTHIAYENGYLDAIREMKKIMGWCEGDPQPAAFPVNPERDANGNAVLYPGMVKYEGVAAIFGTADTDQFVILAPTVEGLKRALSDHDITNSLDVGACRIATLESLPNESSDGVAGSGPNSP